MKDFVTFSLDRPYFLEILAMVEPADGATRDPETPLNLEVDASIRDNDILSFGQDRDDGRN